ncbi:Major Facilitator Superfamily protein [Rhodococcus rhodochrous J3]|uniref:Major Facilitator Superfamily protein n=1 Tax=Rhodococcus rhodochrous J3 TaxID=903528 RepID=A0ABY1MBZ8_RHORH|nr:Arabinose efflux permease [Rhodococcus rhodochrous J38]SMG42267.1 Major Facilitator Superfamily protein [Rhodococcus rhodochrous J3]
MTSYANELSQQKSAVPEGNGRFARQRPVWVIVSVLIAVEIISAFETSMMFAAIPTLITEFDSNASTVGWAVTAFLLVSAASAAVCGRLGDMYGRERILMVLLAVAALGSIVSAVGDSLTSIIIGRAIQGVAGAILPLCIGLAREHLPASRVPVAVALISGSAVAAGSASLLVAGLLIDNASWHMIFVVAAVYAVFALLLVWFVLPWRRPIGTSEKIDYLGAVGFAGAVAAILLGVNKSQAWGWSDARTLGLILGGIVALTLFVRWELRIPSPIINVRLFTDRKFSLTMLATVAIAAGPLGVITMIIPIIMQTPSTGDFGLGLSATHAGWLSFIGSLFGFACTPLSGRISAAVGSRASMLLGTSLFIVGIVVMLTAHHSVVAMTAMVVVVSVASAFAYTAIPNLIVESVPEHNTSETTGTNAVLRTAGQGVGTSIATMLLAFAATPLAGINMVGGMLIVLSVVTIGITLLIPRTVRTV